MKHSVKRIITVIITGFFILFILYIFAGQEYLYAKKYANRLFEYELSKNTEVIEQDFDYGVIYGGGPWGSGGYPTLVAYKKILTELSETEIYEHYNVNDFEIYFEGNKELKKNEKNQIWYEGIKSEYDLNAEDNHGEPIEVIIQYRTEFSYPFFIDLY